MVSSKLLFHKEFWIIPKEKTGKYLCLEITGGYYAGWLSKCFQLSNLEAE